jgi:hypothetical protein
MPDINEFPFKTERQNRLYFFDRLRFEKENEKRNKAIKNAKRRKKRKEKNEKNDL